MQPITIGLSPKVQENETFDRIASNSTIRLIVGESKENIKENISEINRAQSKIKLVSNVAFIYYY